MNWIGEFQKEITEIEYKIRELAEVRTKIIKINIFNHK